MATPIRIGLSIDFDFFSFENPEWDLGHSESGAMANNPILWTARYLHIDLQKECDIGVKADFPPTDVINRLDERGIRIPKNTNLAVADSHKFAYEYFSPMRDSLDLIVNLDAHHDSWPVPKDFTEKDVDCGNWITALGIPNIWIHPSWKDPLTLPEPVSVKNQYSWKDFNFTDDNIVMAVFLCRSSAWVPPHLDEEFGEMLHELSQELYPEYLQYPKIRQGLDYKILARERRKMQKALEHLK